MDSLNNIIFIALFFPLGILYLFLCISKPWWIITALAIYLPFEESLLKWVPDFAYTPLRYLGEITIIFLFFVYASHAILYKKKWQKTPIDIPVLILFGSMAVSAIVNQVPVIVAVLGLKNLWRYIALFYLIILLKPSERRIFTLLANLFTVAIAQAFIAVIQSVVGKPAYDFFAARDVVVGEKVIRSGVAEKLVAGTYHTMVFGTMGRYNMLGNYLSMWLGVALAFFLSKSNTLKVRLWHIMLLIGAMVLSYSRISWIAFLLGSIILFLLSKKNKVLAYIIVISLISFTFLGLFVTQGNNINTSLVDKGIGTPLARYFDVFSSDYWRISLMSGRAYVYASIVPAILRINPLWGLGPGMIASDVSNFLNIDTSSVVAQLALDNPYAVRYLGDAGPAAIIAQVGMIGFIAVVLIFLQLLKSGFFLFHNTNVTWRSISLGYIIITTMMIVFNLTSFALLYRIPSFYFWMFSAFIILQESRLKKQQTRIPCCTIRHLKLNYTHINNMARG